MSDEEEDVQHVQHQQQVRCPTLQYLHYVWCRAAVPPSTHSIATVGQINAKMLGILTSVFQVTVRCSQFIQHYVFQVGCLS